MFKGMYLLPVHHTLLGNPSQTTPKKQKPGAKKSTGLPHNTILRFIDYHHLAVLKPFDIFTKSFAHKS